MISLTIISYIYGAIKDNVIIKTLFYGMSIGVAIVILDAVVTMGKAILKKRQTMTLVVMALAFVIAFFSNVNIVFIILGSAALGIVTTLLSGRSKEGSR